MRRAPRPRRLRPVSLRQAVPAFVGVLLFGAIPSNALAGEYGEVSLDTRLRYGLAESAGRDDADALTLRLRVGYATPAWHGLEAMVEGEFTGVADENSYNAAGVYGDPDKAVIADTKNAQLDQGYLGYTYEATSAKVGRQRIVLGNARWVGDVGWRQNRQTYDAVMVKDATIENLSVFYSYVNNVVRIFGSEAPATGANAEEAGSDSHLINVGYKAHDAAVIAAYVYLLDLDDIPPTLSSDTYGASLTGSAPAGEDLKVNYRAEYAYQQDAASNPRDYQADYYHLVAGGVFKGLMADLGYEVLGGDNTGAVTEEGAPVYAAVQTPLATLHKFNGFADRFLVTPAKGLRDIYIMAGYKFDLPKGGPLIVKLWYHDFTSDIDQDDLGDEWDALLVKPFEIESIPGKFKALAKYAAYDGGDAGGFIDRFTIELNYGVTF